MPRVLINGKLVNVPDSASDADIIRASGKRNIDPSTRTVIKRGSAGEGNHRMRPGEKFAVKDGDKFTFVPNRVKAAGYSYFGNKQEWRDANPGVSFVKMMLIFPDQYPDLPTNGFYLPASLQVPRNAAHFYNRDYGGAFGEKPEEMEFIAQGNWDVLTRPLDD